MINKKFLYIDLFCGAGGTSTGVNQANVNGEQCAKVIACVNHDKNAIASHLANHPNAVHYTEDIRTLDVSKLKDCVIKEKKNNPDSLLVLWASLECTNFSNAKGGLPRNADSRTLAEHLFRYIECLHPDYIQIENVREFMCWGDLDDKGKPISKDKGRLYTKWVQKVCSYGYDFAYKILNSADFGAYTARKRFFGIFAKKGLPITFPTPTHCKGGYVDMFSVLNKWKCVKDVLDLGNHGKSIFREKPLSERTLQRILMGLKKFCTVDSKKQFITTYYGNSNGGNSIDTPSPTVTTKDRISLITPRFLDYQYGNGYNSSINTPAGTVTTTPKMNLISTLSTDAFLLNPQYESSGSSIDKPCFTLIASMNKRPPYLISIKKGDCEVQRNLSSTELAIIEFMKNNDIADVYMRMLSVVELKLIMGFPENYVLVGTIAAQKKYIGNAVEVNTARCICENLFRTINKIAI